MAAMVGASAEEPAPAGSSPAGHDPEVTGPAATPAVADSPSDQSASTAVEPVPSGPRGRRRLRFRGRIRLPRSRRGILALLLVLGGLGGALTFGGVSLLHWTETADFCGRCHSMEPELAAYAAGPHRDVPCADCHVEPGIAGWIKAKLNGTRQIIEMALGTYPTPIPPPDHADLPPATDTCMRCHTVDRLAVAQLKTGVQFTEDEANTRQFVGLMIRPGGGDMLDVNRSVHWHVLRNVVYRRADGNTAPIDYVAARAADGSLREFIAQNEVKVTQDVGPDIERIKSTEPEQTMTCYDCHNRIGHPIPNPRQGMDYDLAHGLIDPSIPYIKRESMRILWSSFPDLAAADAAIDRLSDFYQLRYPASYATKADAINRAIAQVKILYRLTATPEMKVTARTYPDNLGHLDFPGCFRCHDGGHFLVKDGTASKEVIPSDCDTCHTFPQLGPAVASLPLGTPPTSHNDSLWVFNHRSTATALDPGGTSCGECHARDFCVNCHSTGAVKVDHDEMLTNHAKVIRETGNEACAYCHQPVYCARCHNEPVLPGSAPFLEGNTTDGVKTGAPPGVQWPLHPA